VAINPYETPRGRFHLLAQVTRRNFFLFMAALGGLVATLFGGVKVLGFLFPNTTGEEPQVFKVDADPASIAIGNPLQITEKRVSIIRDDAGLYAVKLFCTHLGCTPGYTTDVASDTGDVAGNTNRAKQRGKRQAAEQQPNGWACPCHGSRYFIDSTNFFGPAPRPMDWVDVQFAPDGKLVVDRGKLVVQRFAGDQTPPEWRLDPTSK
jgi:cytochrome b6-f complex iron-sulfur subunit